MFRKSSRRCKFESLESRQLLAATAILKGDILTIRGTNKADQINVERVDSGPDAGKLQVSMNGVQKLFNDGYPGDGTISKIVIRGRNGNDQISIGNNIHIPAFIDGGSGNDLIQGGTADDVILGGSGSDTIFGGDGADKIDGGRGNDQIEGGEGADTCAGGKGNDTLLGNEDDDFLDGGQGNDQIEAGEGDDTCVGGKGNDLIYGGRGKDELKGGVGVDQLFGESGKDVLFGELGNDLLDGGDSDDYLDGGKGNDNALGGAGNDQLKGGVGIDMLDGQEGNNLLDTDVQIETLLNGISVDLDREFYVNFANAGQGSFAKFDLRNVNGQVVEELTIQVHGLVGQSAFDLVIDKTTSASVPVDSNGDGFVHFSTDPVGSQTPFPLNSPPIGSSTTVGGSSAIKGTIVRRFVV